MIGIRIEWTGGPPACPRAHTSKGGRRCSRQPASRGQQFLNLFISTGTPEQQPSVVKGREWEIFLRVGIRAHARNRGVPGRGTSGSSKPVNKQSRGREDQKKKKKSITREVSRMSYPQAASLRTTNTSVFEKQSTRTPTSFVSVIPLYINVEKKVNFLKGSGHFSLEVCRTKKSRVPEDRSPHSNESLLHPLVLVSPAYL